ncbi:MAG TPA: hypothetical protein G4O15_04700 [Dehalococcoidia bacterium]|nr:hypothetical protein [Dehalococcoidia bacterium]
MTRIIIISSDSIQLEAELNDTATADAIWNTLPYEARGSTWGDELYFAIPEELNLDLENGQDVVEIGDLGYWPVGNAFCIFFGSTPASTDERPRPASPVTVVGKVLGDATRLREVRAGVLVYVNKKV